MPAGPIGSAFEHLRRAALRAGEGPGDGELLGRFVERGDAAALAALVGRHGPMVWGVCRRALGHHDAEDALQATFLALARKAASVAPRESVGNWLYGAARRAALLARRTAARRRTREVQVATLPDPVAPPDREPDPPPELDAELGRLPAIYRTVLVLCDLEGRTRADTARTLGVPEGTVAGRLARARALLARRLTARGVAPAAALAALALSPPAASALDAATRIATGQAAVPAPVAALTAGVTNAMLLTTLRTAATAVLLVGIAAATTAFPGRPAAPPDDAKPTAAKAADPPPKDAKPREEVAWGRRFGGLQAGLVVRGGAKAVYRFGDTVTLGIRVRNVGKEPVTFAYVPQFLDETPPTVTDPDGATFPRHLTDVTGVAHPATKVTLEPGKDIELESRFFGAAGRRYVLLPAGGGGAKREPRDWPLFVAPGVMTVRYDRVFGDSSIGKAEVADTHRRLGTGSVELVVEPPAADRNRRD